MKAEIYYTKVYFTQEELTMKNKSIGVFDSGIGGLTVYKALKNKMPERLFAIQPLLMR